MALLVIDFDGTIVDDEYPNIGIIKPNAKLVINRKFDNGHKIVIGSCRTGVMADRAFNFLLMSGIKFHTFNENLPEVIELYGTDTRKMSGDVYIDDKNLGRPIIDWLEIERELKLFHNII